MSWSIIRPQIITLLESLNTLEEVANTPKIRFNGYPAAHVVPSDNTSAYETTSENERQYAWVVRLFYETKISGIENAYIALEALVDQVIDLFDQEDQKGGDTRIVGINLPATYTYINIFANPSRWADFPDEEVVMAEITVKVRISIDVSS